MQQIVGNVIDYERLLFSLRKTFSDLAGMLDEQFRDRTLTAVVDSRRGQSCYSCGFRPWQSE